MKSLIIIVLTLCICGCGSPYPKEKSIEQISFEDSKDKLDAYHIAAKYSLDSMKIINSFIDKLPNNLKGLPVIRKYYIRNLDTSLRINKTCQDMDNITYDLAIKALKKRYNQK